MNAEAFDTALAIGEVGAKYVYVNAFIDTQSPVCGGEFTIGFDGEFAAFCDIKSDVFDVESVESDGKVKIIVATDEGAKLDITEPAFCVKLSTTEKEDFSVTLETEYLLVSDFEKVFSENNTATVMIKRGSGLVYDEPDKEKATVNIERDKSSIIETVSGEKDDDENTDKKSLFPIRINGKNREAGLLLAVGVLLVVVFIFGMCFKRIMTHKDDE